MTRKTRGTTLVELLIAIVVFMFISAAVLMLFRGHLNLNEPLQMRAIKTNDARAAFDILSRELRHVSGIQQGEANSIQFDAKIGTSALMTYKYALVGNWLKREAGGSGMQELIPNAFLLNFEYTNPEGSILPTPITLMTDQAVKGIEVTLGVLSTDGTDTLILCGKVKTRNL